MNAKKDTEQYEKFFSKLVLEGESGCGKTTLIRKVLGTAAVQAGGFITVRICEQKTVCGFVLAPVKLLTKDTMDMTDVHEYQLPCFLSLNEKMQKEEAVFSGYAAEYLRQASGYPFAILDEIGGVELLEDRFYEELIGFLQSDTPWLCVLKSETSAEAMCRRISVNHLYWERYRKIRDLLQQSRDIQHVYMKGFDDIDAKQMVKKWKECQIECQI